MIALATMTGPIVTTGAPGNSVIRTYPSHHFYGSQTRVDTIAIGTNLAPTQRSGKVPQSLWRVDLTATPPLLAGTA